MEGFKMNSLRRPISEKIFNEGKILIPGGVNSPGRAFSEVETLPLVIKEGCGKYIRDEDNNTYLDFICGLGPNILGHGNDLIANAVLAQYKKGTVYATPTKLEFELAEIIINSSKYIDKFRFTCSGTEATMTALRIARAVTGKMQVLKFTGGYHGHSDLLLSGGMKPGMKNSSSFSSLTQIAHFNDIESVETIIGQHGSSIAAIIVEPVPSNMGIIIPDMDFLKSLRNLADLNNIILIFDEVVSGFRHRYGPVADLFNVKPDLITFGKIIGGGLPVGGYGGRKELMDTLISNNGVFQGGTFCGSPLVMAAGISQLNILAEQNISEKINAMGDRLATLLKDEFNKNKLDFSVQNFGSLVTPILIPGKKQLRNYEDVKKQDKVLFKKVFKDLLEAGIAIPPTIEEPIFLSACHNFEDIELLSKLFTQAVLLNTQED